jgi:voltage-dependent potassium channel beta subunit
MDYQLLGKSGLSVSRLSFGSWVTFGHQLDTKKAIELMSYAYDEGVNFFDNAEVYAHGQSEEIMGKCLKELSWSRDSYLVSSKVFWGGDKPTQRGLSRKHIYDCCHAALKRLQVDYLDLYFCHRPDLKTPIEETVFAMNDLIRQGKVLYWGTSEWSAAEIVMAHMVAKENNLIGPTMEQPQYNLFHRKKLERDYLRIFKEIGLGTTIWSPLSSGILTGKYSNGIPDQSRVNLDGYEWLKKQFESDEGREKIEKAKKLEGLASEIGTSLAKMSLAWCLKNPNVSTVILGATKLDQLKENISAKEDVKLLTDEVMEKIEEIVQNKPSEPIQW